MRGAAIVLSLYAACAGAAELRDQLKDLKERLFIPATD